MTVRCRAWPRSWTGSTAATPWGLDGSEAADLVAYLEAVGTGVVPFETFDATNTRFRMRFEEAAVFLSTLEILIPARDRRHALLLLDTVGADLRADAPGMANIAARGRVEALADRIDAIADAVRSGDWQGAGRLWKAYKRAEARDAAALY